MNTGNRQGADYDVGYGKPPREHQFKPGQSGNPRGRRKKHVPPEDGMFRAFSEPVPVQRRGRRVLMPLLEAAAFRLREKALTGSTKDMIALFQVMERYNFFDFQRYRAWYDDMQEKQAAEDRRRGEEVVERLIAESEKGEDVGSEEDIDWSLLARGMSVQDLKSFHAEYMEQCGIFEQELRRRGANLDSDS